MQSWWLLIRCPCNNFICCIRSHGCSQRLGIMVRRSMNDEQSRPRWKIRSHVGSISKAINVYVIHWTWNPYYSPCIGLMEITMIQNVCSNCVWRYDDLECTQQCNMLCIYVDPECTQQRNTMCMKIWWSRMLLTYAAMEWSYCSRVNKWIRWA